MLFLLPCIIPNIAKNAFLKTVLTNEKFEKMESAFMSEFEKVTTGLGEECGVFGAYDMDGGDVAPSVYYGLFALQHRGQESCGIAVTDTYGEKSTFQERPWTGK